MTEGTPIRYTVGPLGVVRSLAVPRLLDEPVNHGDEGAYVRPMPEVDEGWHVTSIERDGETLWVPVHESQFEVAERS